MTHADMDELYELYALGALEPEPASEIDRHIADDCEYCLKHIHTAVEATAMLSGLVDPVEPPKDVRRRVMAAVGPVKSDRRWSFAVPALAFACALLLVLAGWSFIELMGARSSLRQVAGEREQLAEALQVLASSQPKMVQFSQNQGAHGSVFVNANGGFVVYGSKMPQIASEKTFELWLVPKTGNPLPAGLFDASQGAQFVHVFQGPVKVNEIAAVAVSVEPKAGSVAPTTKPILVVPIG